MTNNTQTNTCERCGIVFMSYTRRKFKQPCDYCRNEDFAEAVKDLREDEPFYKEKLAEARQQYLHVS